MPKKSVMRASKTSVDRRRPWTARDLAATHAMIFVAVEVPFEIEPLPFDVSQWREALDELIAVPKQVFVVSDEVTVGRPEVYPLSEEQSDQFRTRNQIGYVVGIKPPWDVVIVVISARVKSRVFSVKRRYSKAQAQAIHDQISCEAFGRLIRRWLFASLLAKVGVLHFSDILVTRGGRELWRR